MSADREGYFEDLYSDEEIEALRAAKAENDLAAALVVDADPTWARDPAVLSRHIGNAAAKFRRLVADKPPVDHDLEAYRLQSDSLRHRMSKAIGLLSTIQASGVLEAHGHDDLDECLEDAIGALVGRQL